MSINHTNNAITGSKGRLAALILGGSAVLALSACGAPVDADQVRAQPAAVDSSWASRSTLGGETWTAHYPAAADPAAAGVPTVGSYWWNLYYDSVGQM